MFVLSILHCSSEKNANKSYDFFKILFPVWWLANVFIYLFCDSLVKVITLNPIADTTTYIRIVMG